jgi:hypothetical protein
MKNEKKYWLDEPRNVDKVFWSLAGVCALLTIVDFFYHKHGHFFWEEWINFYGFISCVGLVLLAKQMRKILMRKEDYYDR